MRTRQSSGSYKFKTLYESHYTLLHLQYRAYEVCGNMWVKVDLSYYINRFRIILLTDLSMSVRLSTRSSETL